MAPKALAPAPSRATITITLSVGVMTFPLSVFTGVEETRVKRSEFTKVDGEYVPVGRAAIRKDTGEVIDSADVVRMAKADTGEMVILTDDEIAACTTTRGLAEIPCFVPNTKVGQYLVQDVKQVRPKREKGKANPAYEKAFALLMLTLKQRKVHALVKIAMRGPARYALLDCNGNLFLIASADQVRQPVTPPWVFAGKEAEIALMSALVDAIGIAAPTLVDDTAPVVQAYVNSKATGVVVEQTPALPPVGEDIMAQLEASVAAIKAAKEVAA